MAIVVSLVGLAVAAIGLLGVATPSRLTAVLAHWPGLTGLPVTVAFRAAFGTLFVLAAPDCRLPAAIRLLGILELAGAVVLLASGPEPLRHFVHWWLSRPCSFVRAWCLAALAFGTLIAYAGAQ